MNATRGMQRKTIIRNLNRKLEEWLKSIEDETLHGLIRKNTIVTGGSIASMLLGEPVNDFDIYFRDIHTTELVAKYYVNKFNQTESIKSQGTKGNHTPGVRREHIVNIKGASEERVIVYIGSAGVAAEGMDTYKYFEAFDPNDAAEFAESLKKELEDDASKPPYRPVFLSQNAITLSDKVQVVIRFYGSPAEIHDNYDFVHAMSYYDWHYGELVIPAKAMESLLSRTLVYHGSMYPLCSIFRAKKFIERGWHIGAGQLLKIMWQISEVDMKNPAVLREQLTGVDQAYMHQLLDALLDVRPEKINSTYVAEIIDRIF